MEAPKRSARDSSIDILRGVVMVLMVLDHVRDYSTSISFNPTDPDKTNTLLFFTRWATHFCAPVFMLLAGAGAGISSVRGKDVRALSRFLLSRGLWLVFLELTVLRLFWTFDITYAFIGVQVIWALGWCMVALSVLVYLPSWLLGIVAGVMVVGHNALDGYQPHTIAWTFLHQQGPVPLWGEHRMFVAYPLVPWIGVMALGYLFGRSWSSFDRQRLIGLGATLTIAFVALRALGFYGDPHPFVARTGIRSVFAFLDCQKYPPSLEYLLMTLGPSVLALGLMRGRPMDNALGRFFVSFGRAPMFFYLLHVPLAHGLTLPFRAARGLPLLAAMFNHGLDLPMSTVYLLWILTVAILWWPTKKWAALKASRKDWWLSYL